MAAIAKDREKLQAAYHAAQQNRAYARMKRAHNKRQKAEADALADLEKEMQLQSKILTEDRSIFETSALGRGRVRADHFKGFSNAQKQAVYAENARQIEKIQAQREAEKAADAEYAAH